MHGHQGTSVDSPTQTPDMGSKISFSRRRSDQYTVSELTAVTSHPCSSFHPPTDCKEVPRATECIEEKQDSEWGEEMKLTNRCKPLPASPSSETLKSEAPVNSNRQPNAVSQLGMDAKTEMAPASVCHLTTDNHGLPVAGRRTRGHPRKIKSSKLKDKMSTSSDKFVANQHEELGTATRVPNFAKSRNAEALFLSHNETSRTCTAPDHKPEDGVSLGSKRKRVRPTERQMAVCENPEDDLARPTQKLRSLVERHLSAPDENNCSDVMVAPKEIELSPPPKSAKLQANEKSNLQIDHQTAAQVCKPDVSVSLVSGDTGTRDVAEMGKLQGLDGKPLQTLPDKPMERDGQNLVVNLCGNRGDVSPRSLVRGKIEQKDGDHEQALSADSKGCPSPHSVDRPEGVEGVMPHMSKQVLQQTYCNNSPKMQPGDGKSLKESACQSNCDNSKNAFPPLMTRPSDNDTAASSDQPPKSVEIPSIVKVENTEAALDHFDPSIKSNTHSNYQQSAKLAACSAGQHFQHTTLRRKKGRKRRRRVPVLLRHEGKGETQYKTDCGDTNTAADQNIIYIRKGSKTLLKCAICSRTYKFMSQYVIHQRVHTGERPFECPECKRGFSKKSNLNLHLKTHVKNTLSQESPDCKMFSDEKYFSHTAIHAKGPDREDSKLSVTDSSGEETLERALAPGKSESKVCQYCGKSFKFQSALIRHERVHTGEKPYKCGICGKAFGQSYFLRVHELTHWSVKRYNCTGCKKSFSHYSNAKNHTCRPPESSSLIEPSQQIAKPSLTYTCHICKNVLDNLQKFNKHMSAHIGTKLYRCLYCDKLFGLLSEFHAHCGLCQGEQKGSCVGVKEEERMSVVEYTVSAHRISSEQKLNPPPANGKSENHKRPPSQMICNNANSIKRTVTRTRLLSHFVSKLNKLDNRSDPRSYLCPSCGRLFRHIGRLRAHMLTHAPHQSYACSYCGKTLQNWTKLWRHQRVHRQRRGRFTCALCGKGFRFVESYKNHMSEHPGFRWIHSKPKTVFLPYNCDQCTSRFKTLDLLFSHQLCHFSAQVIRLGPVLDQSLYDHSAQSTSMLNPVTNRQAVTLSFESGNNTLASSVPKGSARLASQNQDLHPKESPFLTWTSSDQKQDFGLDKSAQSARTTHMREKPPRRPRKDRDVLKKQKAPPRTANRYPSPQKGSSQGLICAMCGHEYAVLSDLYHHYLQHARGQV
ncbi:uncharacterized protein LOC109525588 [Hippocampus comes]|uniref:uncharacterized protein LOC109525588 n=1 Tax=Hippocampus comes TaxID=109280 RepID=UPI00094F12E7|nr:PREDICTED: uncharacterized protein LOC109525588 [Hippocampus comes]